MKIDTRLNAICTRFRENKIELEEMLKAKAKHNC